MYNWRKHQSDFFNLKYTLLFLQPAFILPHITRNYFAISESLTFFAFKQTINSSYQRQNNVFSKFITDYLLNNLNKPSKYNDPHPLAYAYAHRKNVAGRQWTHVLRLSKNMSYQYATNGTSSVLMKCKKNSCASCCLFVENNGCPLPIRALNICGEIPGCNSSVICFASEASAGGCEYFPFNRPNPSLALNVERGKY